MWETIGNVLVSGNGLVIIVLVAIIIWALLRMSKKGLLNVKSKYVTLGNDAGDEMERNREQALERKIIREQCDWVHIYLMGLMVQIKGFSQDLTYDGILAKYILEVVYDEFVKWIMLNHITDTPAYIHTRQEKMVSLVYGIPIPNEAFKTEIFRENMRNWVEVIIKELVQIRKMYTEEAYGKKKKLVQLEEVNEECEDI